MLNICELTKPCDFVCQPVQQTDGYIADTAAPTKEDTYIASIADPEMQTELRWQKYVQKLEEGAWGDHVAMQAIADMLSLTTITLLSSDYPVYSVTPAKLTVCIISLKCWSDIMSDHPQFWSDMI